MPEFTLTREEAGTVAEILRNYLSDLRMEIVDTEGYEAQIELRARRDTLRAILERFERGGVPSAGRSNG